MIMNDADAATRIGQRLRRARHAAGLTLEQLADRADLSVPTVSNAEHGTRQPRLGTLHKLAAALHIPVGTLLVDPSPPSPPPAPTRTPTSAAQTPHAAQDTASDHQTADSDDTADGANAGADAGAGMDVDWSTGPTAGLDGASEGIGATH